MNKERFDVMSIPGYVIKKNPSHGARHGSSVRQTLYFPAHDMLRKARSNKNGNCKTLPARWYKDDQHRKSLSDIGKTEEQVKQYDALVLEDHSNVSTPEERSRHKNYWEFPLNKEGIRGPINQRSDFMTQSRNANDCTTNTLKELVKETDRSILHSKPDSDVTNKSRASMGTITQLILELDGNFTLQPDQQPRLRQRTGSSTTCHTPHFNTYSHSHIHHATRVAQGCKIVPP